MGVPHGKPTQLAQEFMARFRLKGGAASALRSELQAILDAPAQFLEDPLRSAFAKAMSRVSVFVPGKSAPWKQWGSNLDEESVKQMERACQLPISVQGVGVSSQRVACHSRPEAPQEPQEMNYNSWCSLLSNTRLTPR